MPITYYTIEASGRLIVVIAAAVRVLRAPSPDVLLRLILWDAVIFAGTCCGHSLCFAMLRCVIYTRYVIWCIFFCFRKLFFQSFRWNRTKAGGWPSEKQSRYYSHLLRIDPKTLVRQLRGEADQHLTQVGKIRSARSPVHHLDLSFKADMLLMCMI